jgi:predicted N-acetyltransferase YhbS
MLHRPEQGEWPSGGNTTVRGGRRQEGIQLAEMDYRILSRDEIEKFREIDRSEIIENDYRYEDGRLELVKVHYDVKGFSPDHLKSLIGRLHSIHDKGGVVFGAFDGPRLVGLAALDSKLRGEDKDTLNYAVLHVSNPYRRMGIGKTLTELVKAKAREMGARILYVSSAPTKSTVDFYMSLGCKLADRVDEELFELEPEDIHLVMEL